MRREWGSLLPPSYPPAPHFPLIHLLSPKPCWRYTLIPTPTCIHTRNGFPTTFAEHLTWTLTQLSPVTSPSPTSQGWPSCEEGE